MCPGCFCHTELPPREPALNADHKLLNHKYGSLDNLIDDLHNWAASALFAIKKLRTANVRGITYSGFIWRVGFNAHNAQGARRHYKGVYTRWNNPSYYEGFGYSI
ncbi:hypothetical protein B0T26DRAFT_673273 [Lasiosphaeria miniovina]|uniref:Uncharacterized protein n=1 Tax=Lasiosphaeria miniovina TaxID=1954250 RepID=A0AA40B6W9_9PEZI|nr:uncharacterized protein B0T26DRAFT_673273 [Lasiosphaeria miniovina]KAK0728800.1 hypothetical protein B0T26DRAFT_673273 [Lasiosphaeria miniovina]